MFKKILIANRGEIALRVIRTCREMGIKTVAVYSTADKDSLHVRFADEAVCIGKAAGAESYLNIPHLMAAAEITNADAIHPGYGFLAENANFAEICAKYNIKFIGPTPEMIRAMGDKITAKETMIKAGVPCIPGSDGLLESLEQAKQLAEEMGFPVILKATAGGGGKGMRVVWAAEELERAYNTAKAEAGASFKNDGIYMEKFVEEPRHIEIQIAGDQFGAGTIEYLVDKHRNFYFMEMNTRIQVEHCVTEEVINFDLIKEQIKIAAGIPISGKNYEPQMHAIECRINAEDPYNDFRPSPGTITVLHTPGGHGVRVDSHIYAGYTIPPYYDSMVSKIIAIAQTREEAINTMERALSEYVIEGVKTTIPFHQQLMKNKDFREGNFTTKFIESFEMK